MALKFYIQIKGKVSGPLSGSELMSLAQLGKLLPTDMVRQDGSDKWVQANRIRNLAFGSPQVKVEEEIEEILGLEPAPPKKTSHEVEEEIEEVLGLEHARLNKLYQELEEDILEIEPIRQTTAPRANNQPAQQHFLINDDLPPPPNYGFVEFVAGVYTFLGVLTPIVSVIAVFIVMAMESNGRDGGQKVGVIFGIIMFGGITSISCFAMAQLFVMSINGSKNLHYIMHSNLVAMRVMVRQFSKKD
jgi:hypothetical protein